MKIRYGREFKEQYTRVPKKIKQAFKNRRNLFLKNPHAPILSNHKLRGRLKGYRSINITGDWRAIYSQINSRTIIFEIFGTHSQMYK